MNVLFVNMPFNATRPAIGVSLLKSHLQRIGVSSRIAYFNMKFECLVGESDYKYIAENAPAQSVMGDWIFSRAAFGANDKADAAYLETFMQRFGNLASTADAIPIAKRVRQVTDKFLQECFDEIDWQAYDVVGFTSTFAQHVASLALAGRVKERFPHIVIIFGGANCEEEMGLQLHRSFPFIDYVWSGEADIGFPKLIQELKDGKRRHQIPGLISRVDGDSHYTSLAPEQVNDMDALPYPNYDDYFEQRAILLPQKQSGVLMESSRGCWWGQKHHCTFCGLNGMSMAFRSKSAARVLDEITSLCGQYKQRFVEMVDNILDMQYFHDLLPELHSRGLKLGLFYETKANLTKDQVRLLRDAGVDTIQPGIESFSTEILHIMRKGTSAVQNVQLLKWCKEIGVKPFWNMIYGFPGEDPGDYESTARIVDSIHHFQPPFGFGAIRLDRFSPNFFSAKELGFCNIRPDRSYGYIYRLAQDELFHLAYYFEHDYEDGRDPESYVSEAYTSVKRWHEDSDTRGLVYADHGQRLALWDFRSCADKTLNILSGEERAVYLYCDQNHSLPQIRTFLSERGASNIELEPFLDRLVNSRLMLNLDGRYLSLAIPASSMPANGNHGTKQQTDHVLL
ncbi:MAG TPA: RiPP maturation radical SAM C-methyltransferase [Pyrinomonadaceae bacterium]|nr:RiPP maturation radical SAM C-methyltransferase [Pyrinomonadaceae bacterium]